VYKRQIGKAWVAFYKGLWNKIKKIGAILLKLGKIVANVFRGKFKEAKAGFDELKREFKKPVEMTVDIKTTTSGGGAPAAGEGQSLTNTITTETETVGGAGGGETAGGGTPSAASAASAGESNASAYTSAFVEAIQSNEDAWAMLSETMAEQISTGILEFMIEPISEGMSYFADTMVSVFTETFGQLLSPITMFIQSGIKMFADFLKKLILQYLGFKKIFTMITKGLGMAWDFLTNNMVVKWLWAMGIWIATTIANAIIAINAFALTAAAAAFQAMAVIPIIGPILGIIAYAATYAFIVGGVAKLAGLAKGTPEVVGGGASDTVPAMLTPGEMVVPKDMAQGIRDGDVALGGDAEGEEETDEEGAAVGGGDTFIFQGDINGVTEDLIQLIADGLRQAVATGLTAPI